MSGSADLLQIGVSGLLAYQRSLASVGHNVSNATTPGYSRQTVDLQAAPAQLLGGNYMGSGVQIEQVRRSYDSFLTAQVRTFTTTHSQYDVFHSLASQVDSLLGDSQAGLAPQLQSFFSAVQGVANDPSSTSARQVMLSEAGSLADRFHSLDSQLSGLRDDVNSRVQSTVGDINSLATSLAQLNQQIVSAQGTAGGQPPNDLLDQRDVLLAQLSEQVTVSSIPQPDGSVNVLVGNGQAIVLGSRSVSFGTAPSPDDSSRLEITYDTGASKVAVTSQLVGGTLGGVLDFRKQVLGPAQNALGRIAVGLADSFNAQHRAGMTLDGSLGGDFFSVPDPVVSANSNNTGSGSVSAKVSDPSALTTSDYNLAYDGNNYVLTRQSDGKTWTQPGSSYNNVDGLTLTLSSGAMSVGDSFAIRPTRGAATGLQVAVTTTNDIAAAAPIRTVAASVNQGNATISSGEVLDATKLPTDLSLLPTFHINFDTPSSYTVTDQSGNLLSNGSYQSGVDIDYFKTNLGLRVQISGTPQAGDTFTVEPNTLGVGDNRNALLLSGLQSQRILDGGSTTYQSAYGQLISSVGVSTHQADIAVTSYAASLEHAQSARDSAAGVNLDEEAANILKFQQSYQAAAQVISVANTLFDTLLHAVGR